MDQSLKGTPASWVRLEKDAQAPISREKQDVASEVGDKKTYRAARHHWLYFSSCTATA